MKPFNALKQLWNGWDDKWMRPEQILQKHRCWCVYFLRHFGKKELEVSSSIQKQRVSLLYYETICFIIKHTHILIKHTQFIIKDTQFYYYTHTHTIFSINTHTVYFNIKHKLCQKYNWLTFYYFQYLEGKNLAGFPRQAQNCQFRAA